MATPQTVRPQAKSHYTLHEIMQNTISTGDKFFIKTG